MARTLTSSPLRELTTPWIFCFAPCGTWTGWELSEFWADAATAVINRRQATATNPAKDLRLLIGVLLLLSGFQRTSLFSGCFQIWSAGTDFPRRRASAP